MKTLMKNGMVFSGGSFFQGDILITNGVIAAISPHIPNEAADAVSDFSKYYIFPGLADVHVHLREPGFSYKETIAAGTLAAARGGYTTVCAMPNLSPAPDTAENLNAQLEIIRRDALIPVIPYGCITMQGAGRGELARIEEMAPAVCAFTDDGKGVQDGDTMRRAMLIAKAQGKIIAAHCEDESLLTPGGCIHDGGWARENGFAGISSESEWRQVERDIALVRETGCDYHICHVSTRESVAIIRRAKAEGLSVTCETAPHYLLLDDTMLVDEGRFKMNPPIRSAEDRDALLEAISDGTVDMIATDHAPHSAEEKSKGLNGSAFGIVGLEAALAVLYTGLVQTGKITLERLIGLMSVNPRARFKLGGGEMKVGEKADFAVFDPSVSYVIDPRSFASLGRATPFSGMKVMGKIKEIRIGDKTI